MEIETLPTTDRECWLCEDGHFVRDGHELICEECQFSPTPHASRTTVDRGPDPWERFWSERDEYDGTKGPERKKGIGGFAGPYP